jgi:hypothetical protein
MTASRRRSTAARLAHRGEDGDGGGVVPVVQDVHQDVGVGIGEGVGEEVACDDVKAARAGDLGGDCGQLEQHLAGLGVTVEDGLQQVAVAAAHVADALVPGEVVRVLDCGDVIVGFGRHRRLEDGALAGVSVEAGDPSAWVQLGDPGLAGADRVVRWPRASQQNSVPVMRAKARRDCGWTERRRRDASVCIHRPFASRTNKPRSSSRRRIRASASGSVDVAAARSAAVRGLVMQAVGDSAVGSNLQRPAGHVGAGQFQDHLGRHGSGHGTKVRTGGRCLHRGCCGFHWHLEPGTLPGFGRYYAGATQCGCRLVS